jgi:hypothetical protein
MMTEENMSPAHQCTHAIKKTTKIAFLLMATAHEHIIDNSMLNFI